ncbi:hypothetical protein ACFO3K_11420 [Cellulomonas algicola]|uniref:AMIN-like domain-containing (lipo)protein n=1 Tax=Cellulomonas algicola TaxID=2071633 RepID=UPI001C3FD19B|nr:hypothetical protein [Cellulomonas algicola]
MTTRRRTVLTTAVLCTLLAACGQGTPGADGSSSPTASATGSPTGTPTSPAPSATTPAPEPGAEAEAGDFSPANAQLTADPSGTPVTVTDVRVGSHEGYDRVVYEVAGGGVPGYRVTYVDQAVEDGSGATVDVAGDAVLDVWLTGTGYPHDTGHEEFAQDVGPREGTVVQVTRPLTFEGMTQSVVGVAGERRPFRVFVLQDPVRVVVDVQSS